MSKYLFFTGEWGVEDCGLGGDGNEGWVDCRTYKEEVGVNYPWSKAGYINVDTHFLKRRLKKHTQ